MYHISVLKNEVLNFLVNNETGTYLDVTVGGGGHSYALLEKYPYIKMICSDWDFCAIKESENKLTPFIDRVTLIHSNFSHIEKNLNSLGITKVAGILADFGTSQYQLLHRDGFSFQYDSFLDMRMSNSHTKIMAVDILRTYSFKKLSDIFYYYGQEKYARKIASAIVKERINRPIRSSLHLSQLILNIVPRSSHIHPATKVFQALRIEVNKELVQIESLFHQVNDILAIGGRIACISFHSLEDGIVKRFYQNHKAQFKVIGNDKIILPKDAEIKINPASRSAKMRVFERVAE